MQLYTLFTTMWTTPLIPQIHLLELAKFSDKILTVIKMHISFTYCLYLYYFPLIPLNILFFFITTCQLEHTAEDFDEIKDTEYHPELCSVNIITEAPTDPSDPPASPTQSHEDTTVNFLPQAHLSELESASSSPVQEINE